MSDKGATDPARLTPTDEGKATGSASQSSSLPARSGARETELREKLRLLARDIGTVRTVAARPTGPDPERDKMLARLQQWQDDLFSVIDALHTSDPVPLAAEPRTDGPPLVVMYLRRELCAWLNTIAITSDNIGDIRRSLFVPWDSKWNGIVRDETANRENKPLPAPPQEETP